MEFLTDNAKYGAQRMVYHRVDLHEALKEAAIATNGNGNPVEIVPASRVAAVNCEDGIVSLKNGDTYKGDLVIGADGIHSVVRTAVVGEDAPLPKPTGVSAYRLLLEVSNLEKSSAFTSIINPRDPVTTMVIGHDRRIIMGPGRSGTIFGVVALVPDEHMHEKSSTGSWTSDGSLQKLVESFAEFPPWIKELLTISTDAPALYQLRDIDPLKTWIRGRTILIGDAAHAMLPTQGQGASQSFEDAEALQAFLGDLPVGFSQEKLSHALQEVFETRYARTSLIQAYSRQQAGSATKKGSTEIKLNPAEFMDYNCRYGGAKDWRRQQIDLQRVQVPTTEVISRTV
jgi:salicylate hydroxylase